MLATPRPRTALLLLSILTPSTASAQLLVPIGQDRHVMGEGEGTQSGTTITDLQEDHALDFGTFDSSASVLVNPPGFLANAGGWQDSTLLPDGFQAEGSSFATTETCDGWNVSARGTSRAQIDFQVAEHVQYELEGYVEGYDGGYGSWQLETLTGTWIDGGIGIAKGVVSMDSTGFLNPGSYRLWYLADSGAWSSSCEYGYGSVNYDLEFTLNPVTSSYCVGAPNSSGPGSTLTPIGAPDLSVNNFRIRATGAVPSQFGLFYYGPDTVQQPFGDGFRCVSGTTFRVGPAQSIAGNGTFLQPIDFTSGTTGSGPGQILAGSTWNFQFWYRDPAGPGGTGFNLSDALQVIFQP